MAKNGSVRMGPISLFTLIAVIVLAVMAVLTLVTANAAHAVSTRQAHAVTCAYTAETAAQTFVAAVDGEFVTAQAQSDDPAAALQALEAALPDLAAQAQAIAGTDAQVTAQIDGTQITASFVVLERRLDITLEVAQEVGVQITSWKLTTVQDQTTSETLWQGAAN